MWDPSVIFKDQVIGNVIQMLSVNHSNVLNKSNVNADLATNVNLSWVARDKDGGDHYVYFSYGSILIFEMEVMKHM